MWTDWYIYYGNNKGGDNEKQRLRRKQADDGKECDMVSQTRVDHVLNMAGSSTRDFNCWGATMFIEQAKDRLGWVENQEIGEWLQDNYLPIDKAKVQQGDILALFDRDEVAKCLHLVHTAVCIGGGRYVHKIGQNKAQTDNLRGVLQHYAFCGNSYAFMRLKGEQNED